MASEKVKQKREKMKREILHQAMPLIESGIYNQLTIRELCERMGITTGMFYRYYKTKNDLMSFYTVERSSSLYEENKEKLSHMTLREKLLHLSLLAMQPLTVTGPDSILMYVDDDGDGERSCNISREIFCEQIKEAFATSCTEDQYEEADVSRVCEYLVVLEKGLCFEMYSQKNNPDFDLMDRCRDLFGQMIGALDLPAE